MTGEPEAAFIGVGYPNRLASYVVTLYEICNSRDGARFSRFHQGSKFRRDVGVCVATLCVLGDEGRREQGGGWCYWGR